MSTIFYEVKSKRLNRGRVCEEHTMLSATNCANLLVIWSNLAAIIAQGLIECVIQRFNDAEPKFEQDEVLVGPAQGCHWIVQIHFGYVVELAQSLHQNV